MELNKRTIKKLLAIIAFAIVLYWGLQNINVVSGALKKGITLFTPLILGFCIAFVLNVPLRALERILFNKNKNKFVAKIKRPICLILSILIILGVFSAVMGLVVPEVINTGKVLATTIPAFLDEMLQWAQDWAARNSETIPGIESWLTSLDINWAETTKTVWNYVQKGATGVLGSTVAVISATFNSVINFVVAFIFAIYIIMNKEQLKTQISHTVFAYLPQKVALRLTEIVKLSSRIFASFITGQCLEAVILGSLCAVTMSIFRLPYAAMVGALVGVTALIPIVGAFIGTFVGAFMIMMVNPLQAVEFVIVLLVLQQIEGNLIYPRVVGSSVGLPAMWVLAAVTVGGGLMGVLGMLVGVPLCSIVYALMQQSVHSRLKAKELATDGPCSDAAQPQKQEESEKPVQNQKNKKV
ncbi:MAG: AI-2E family transporter [Oscillospiraceae bacterium]|nr:AI-2E family transporter [Oscillospiraceae bacterium]